MNATRKNVYILAFPGFHKGTHRESVQIVLQPLLLINLEIETYFLIKTNFANNILTKGIYTNDENTLTTKIFYPVGPTKGPTKITEDIFSCWLRYHYPTPHCNRPHPRS